MLKKIAIVLVGLVLAFVLHIPVLKWATRMPDSARAQYAPLSDGVQGEQVEIARIFTGTIYGVAYDPQTRHYLILGRNTGSPDQGGPGSYLLTLDQSGQMIDGQAIPDSARTTALANPRYQDVPRLLAQQDIPNYDFDQLPAWITLAHYTFESFDQWPRFVYFFPMVYTDWEGEAYLDITHGGEVLRARIPTFFSGGFLYLGSSIDGQIYPRKPDGGDIAFLEVTESSFTLSAMTGQETHRKGLGLYVIRPR